MSVTVLEELERIVKEATKGVDIKTPLTDAERAQARGLLGAFIKAFWLSPLGLKIRNELSNLASEYGANLEIEAKRLGIDKVYKEIAEKTAIGKKFRMTWGKPAK